MGRIKEQILKEEEKSLNMYKMTINTLIKILNISQDKQETTKEILENLLHDVYVQGWEDGMSEGTEHTEQLRKHQEKYE